MSEISISLSNIRNIKRVNVEEVGVINIRRLGAGEELDLSSKFRRLNAILKELGTIDFTKPDTSTPEGLKEIERLSKKADALSVEIEDIKRFEFETYKKCLSDDEDGKVVKEIMDTFTEAERAELFRQVFEPPKVIDTPDSVQATVSDDKEKDSE